MNIHAWITETTIAGNEIWRVFLLFAIMLISLTAGKIASAILALVTSKRDRAGEPIQATCLSALASTSSFIMLVVGIKLVLALDILVLSHGVMDVAETVASLLLIMTVTLLAYRLVDVVEHWLERLAERSEGKMDKMLVPLVRKSLRITIIILAMMQVATTPSDKPVTSLLSGLGIGSLVLALGAQETMNVNFEILRRFNEAGIDFAPPQTLYLAGDVKRSLEPQKT